MSDDAPVATTIEAPVSPVEVHTPLQELPPFAVVPFFKVRSDAVLLEHRIHYVGDGLIGPPGAHVEVAVAVMPDGALLISFGPRSERQSRRYILPIDEFVAKAFIIDCELREKQTSKHPLGSSPSILVPR